MSAKKTEENYHELAALRGFTWDGKELPKNVLTKTPWGCSHGHTWEAHFHSIQQGSGCPVCAREARRKKREDYHELAALRGFTWAGKEMPKNTSTKTPWRCSLVHTWEASYYTIKRGSGCPHCAGVARKESKDYHELAALRGFTWASKKLPKNTSTKTSWRCSRAHTWEAPFYSIKHGRGCPVCFGIARKNEKDYRALANQRGLKWVGGALPKNTITKTKWECSQSHVFSKSYAGVRQTKWCPDCYFGSARGIIIDGNACACRRCGSANINKNGHNKFGSLQYRCKDCGKSAVLHPRTYYTDEEKERILAAHQEGSSIREISRVFGVSRVTVASWLKKPQPSRLKLYSNSPKSDSRLYP